VAVIPSRKADDPDTDPAARQEPVLTFLSGALGETTRRVDTHASIVFLAPDKVLKVKRAVRLPFLDYSTLERRKKACEEELAVNRRHAPDLYRRVVPITQERHSLQIGGDGPAVEWAVEMARFDERRTLDHLAGSGEITGEIAERLAEVMLASHREAAIADGARWLGSLSGIIDRNTEKFRDQTSVAADAVERLHRSSHARLALQFPLLQQRAAGGFVRRCHGDAHLANIVLIERRPVLFDAIEFDPDIATTDILYDLAFPLMDLVHFAERAAANRLFNRYLLATWQDNANALALLPLFLSVRAAIRANVLFTRHEQSAGDRATITQAKSYFDLALGLITPQPPLLLAIGGKSGTGKTVLARNIAAVLDPPPGAVVLRSDVIRKELFGVDPLSALPESAYAPEVTARVYETLAARGDMLLKQGISVVLDAAFLKAEERDQMPSLATSARASFCGVFLDAGRAIRLQRIAARRHDESDATAEVVLKQEAYDIGKLDWPVVDASGSAHETLARAAQTAKLKAFPTG
jgi:uncharacterized protein